MKKIILSLVFLFTLFSGIYAQEWVKDLPQDKLAKGTLTFYEIQKAFYDYWEPFNVVNGYYMIDGQEEKAPYYKLFKRWEWYWENRIDPLTGEFPDRSALDEYYKSLKDNRSTAGNWTSVGPNSSPGGYAGLGRLNCVAFVPGSPDEYYAGSASGGIWYTDDDGANWVNLNDTVPVLGVSDILVIDPVMGPDILFIATGDRDGGALWSIGGQQSNDNNSVGVLKSNDGGATWSPTGLSFSPSQKVRVNRLLMDPNSAYQTIYAATTQGLYKTTDAGANWSQMTSLAFIDMEFKPGNPSTLYGSTEGSSSTSIYVSTNSGSSWTSVATYTGIRTELAVSYNQTNWVYALVAASGGGLEGVYQSTNSGSSFTQVYSGATNNLLGWNCNGSGTGGQGSYDLCIAADPNNANTVYIGGVNTWKSTNGGSAFSIVNHWTGCWSPNYAQNVHADKHFLAFQNGTSTLFECNDGGLYKSSDGGSSWSHLSDGMAISQIYRMGVGQTQDGEVVTGLQDNGTKARLSGTWNDVIGGDGFECIVDYTDETVQYGALYYGDIYRTTDYWWSSTQITGSLPGSGWWCTPYLIDPVNHNTLYVGYEDVWKSTDQGNNWSRISNQGSSTDFRNMAISASNTNYIYAATLGNVYRTTDGGNASQVWANITGNLPVSTANITYIWVKNDNPDHVWVSMGGYNSDGVYETTNGGSSWTNISGGLPLVPVMCVIQNTQYTQGVELYAGTDVGVYFKRDGSGWASFSDGLPNVVVSELDIYYDSNPANSRIYAATYGRGVWSSDLYSQYQQPVADFMGTPTAGLPPLNVAFTDLSQNTVTGWTWDFGDGNTSTQQNPMNQYTSPGLYHVKLVVSGPGGMDSTTKNDYIRVDYFPPTADFTADVTSGTVPLTVNFTDLSLDTVNTWLWNFGDGVTSPLKNPAHQYQNAGLYTVSLTVGGPGGSNTHTRTDYITVSELPPIADFVGNPTSGSFPLDVSFTDLSTGIVDNWKWHFGDGNSSTVQNPVHTYENTGNYTVSLVSTGPGGSDSIAKEDYITILVGLEEFLADGYAIFPNPASGIVRIRYRMQDPGSRMIELFGISGKSIRKLEEGNILPGIYQTTLDVSDLEDGVYLLKIQIGNEIAVRKLVVGG